LNAFGYLMAEATQQHKRQPDVGTASASMATPDFPVEHPEFNRDATRQMMRRQNKVLLLTDVPDVREASTELVQAVMAIAAVVHDDPHWSLHVAGVTARVTEATRRFQEAAAAELRD
jgi:hypothetical protein